MDLVLSIDIDNDNEACVKTAAIKARRRQNHICLAIQQIAHFLAACILIAVVMWSLLSSKIHKVLDIVMTIILSFLAVIMLIISSNIVYEYYQYNGQHDDQYDIPCGKYGKIHTPWFIKWCIRKGKKLFKC